MDLPLALRSTTLTVNVCEGIIFVLLTVRAHSLDKEAKVIPASASLIPGWLFDTREPRTPTGLDDKAEAGIETSEGE